MIVYRFERQGLGPYMGGLKAASFKAGLKDPRRAKIVKHKVSQVKIDMSHHWDAVKNQDHIFGCPSKEMLRVYFGYRFKHMFCEGYRIRTYNVPDNEVLLMGVECAFPVKYHKFKTKKRLQKAVGRK